ncbi:MAG: ABC transporter ATP-binding protein/permease [Proteobacteria bacterium]|nr:ABC transporter ATP-binding protein/permease [Pseudomonadota bacterium]
MKNIFPSSQFTPLLQETTPSAKTLVALIGLMLFENLFSLFSPWLAGQFSEVLLHGSAKIPLNYRQILLAWLCLILVQAILSYYSRIISGVAGERMVIKLRNKLYSHLQALPVLFFHERKHGQILSLLSYDTTVIGTFVSGTLIGFIPLFVTAAGAIVCMYLINPLVACLSTLLIPLFVLITKILGRKIRPLSQDLMRQYGTTFSIAEENLSTLPLIKSFSRESIEYQRFATSNDDLLTTTKRYINAQAQLAPITRFLASAIIIVFLLLAGDRFMAGNMSTGNFVSLMLYGLLLTRPISGMAEAYGQTQRALAAARRLGEVFEQKKENFSFGTVLPPVMGKITFTDVAFGYPDREVLFPSLNLEILPGETIAITGKNGAGKSTIVHLLIRLYNPLSGTIRIDDNDIRDVTLESLRSQIGLVQQNVLLRNSSVRDNLLFGKHDAETADLVKAAKAAHAYEFIISLPAGFDTLIGDQGVKLSGGQKQRLSLARALLKNPPILILDEATAMFDPEGESSFIRDNLAALRDRTVIIITHRPATLALADRIYELKDGALHLLS